MTTGDIDDPQAYWTSLIELHVQSKYLTLAGLAWMVWEFMITLDDSAILFHSQRRLSLSRTLFVLNRLIPLTGYAVYAASLITFSAPLSLCAGSPWILMVAVQTTIIVLSTTLIARVYALWDRSKLVLVLCCLGFVATDGPNLAIAIWLFSGGESFSQTAPFSGCLSTTRPYTHHWLGYFLSLSFETAMVGMMLFKTWPIVRQRCTTPVFDILFYDGIWYYLVIMLFKIFNTVAMYQPDLYPVLISSMMVPLESILCNRLLIHLQKVLVRNPRLGGDITTMHADHFFTSSSIPSSRYSITQCRDIMISAPAINDTTSEIHQHLDQEGDRDQLQMQLFTEGYIYGTRDEEKSKTDIGHHEETTDRRTSRLSLPLP